MSKIYIKKIKGIYVYLSIGVSIVIIYSVIGILFLKLGSIKYQQKDYSKAETYYRYASKFVLTKARAQDRLNTLKYEVTTVQNNQTSTDTPIIIPTDTIKMVNATVSIGNIENFSNEMDPPDLYRRYLISAILKNTSGYGIPIVKVTKLNMYDNAGKLVMTKDTPIQDILMVKDGEIPFTYYFNLREAHDIQIHRFSLEYEIPPFTPNPDVIRLNVIDTTLLIKNPVSEGSKSYKYRYKLTVENPTNTNVKDIYRISFLTFNGLPLTRSGHECCLGLETVEETKNDGVIRIEDLNRPSSPLIFQPREKKELMIEMIVDEVFNEFGNQYTYNPNSVKPEIVIIGTKYIPY